MTRRSLTLSQIASQYYMIPEIHNTFLMLPIIIDSRRFNKAISVAGGKCISCGDIDDVFYFFHRVIII